MRREQHVRYRERCEIRDERVQLVLHEAEMSLGVLDELLQRNRAVHVNRLAEAAGALLPGLEVAVGAVAHEHGAERGDALNRNAADLCPVRELEAYLPDVRLLGILRPVSLRHFADDGQRDRVYG